MARKDAQEGEASAETDPHEAGMTQAAAVPACRAIVVKAFRGDRSRAYSAWFRRALDDEKEGPGPGPGPVDCLLHAGHTAVSTDGGKTLWGFNPDARSCPVWRLMDALKNGDRFHGAVRNDTPVFRAADKHSLPILSFEIILPDHAVQAFERELDRERWKSQYFYGFPNGDGDCNCTTWLERLGLPLLTGRMDEFAGLLSSTAYPSRRFGKCN